MYVRLPVCLTVFSLQYLCIIFHQWLEVTGTASGLKNLVPTIVRSLTTDTDDKRENAPPLRHTGYVAGYDLVTSRHPRYVSPTFVYLMGKTLSAPVYQYCLLLLYVRRPVYLAV